MNWTKPWRPLSSPTDGGHGPAGDLEELIQLAKENGVKLVACQMSMDVMGIKPAELIDGVEIGGAAMYLGEAEQSNVNLFI
ncbi:DsrE/DsrF/DrsH-like family protein [Desulforamulus putei DSM 12395]|uniref:DsrE/DsrF/DrsH-like family protein n=1 Tax=Desulforamulus putei DSM 12395 TaxID=1121429 RepID=A0A1M5A641_9FIRM|nr:DsrE/DsrF/DrsH-like family protein [Desulforamulus putei DSM 12395]